MRAVLDANVLIAALLSPSGAPAALLRRWFDGDFDLVVSALLLAELARALTYPKIRSRIAAADADAFVELLGRTATLWDDPAVAAARSRDPGDDYLLALAESSGAMLVTGDQDLLAAKGLPVMSPRAFVTKLSLP